MPFPVHAHIGGDAPEVSATLSQAAIVFGNVAKTPIPHSESSTRCSSSPWKMV